MNTTRLLYLIHSLTLGATLGPGLVAADMDEPPAGLHFETSLSAAGSGGVILKQNGVSTPALRSEEWTAGLKAQQHFGVGTLSAGISLQRTAFSEASGWTLPLPSHLKEEEFVFSFEGSLSPAWTYAALVNLGWRGAFTRGGGDLGFGATGGLLAFYQASEKLHFSVGFMGDTLAVGNNRLLPVAGIDWQWDPKWRLSLGLPRTGLFWSATKTLEVGLVGEGTWNTYPVDRAAVLPTVAGGVLAGSLLEFSEARAGIQVKYDVSERLSVQLTAGVIGVRRFEYPERHLVLKTTGVDGGYLSANVTYGF